MEKRGLCLAFFAGLVLSSLFFVPAVFAQGEEELEEQKGEYCGICETKKRVNNIAPWLEVGGDFRFRTILDDARQFDRKQRGHDRV